MEFDANSAFFPVVGLGAAFLMSLAGTDDPKEHWPEIIGMTLGFGLILFTPALYILASFLG